MGLIADIHDDIEKGAVRLITEYRARLFSDAVRLCGNATDAEDLVDRTFLKVINRLDQHNPDKNFYGWMKTILVNLHRDDLDRPVTRGTVPVEDSILAQHAGVDWSTDEQILKNSDGEAVREALRHIDPEFRQLVLMRYYDEFSLKEIASILNKPIGTVSRRIQIALRLLAGKLEAELGNSKAKLAAFAAIILSFVSFAAWQTAEAVRSHFSEEPVAAESALGSLGLGGTFRASADAAVFADANTLSTNEDTQKEEHMNTKSITQATVKLAVGAALASGFSAEALAKDASTYVQDGLIGHWDGIDNAGVGEHDSTGTVWKDLTGTTGDFTLESATWSNGNGLKKTANGYMARRGDRKEGVAMYETVVSDIPSSGWVVPVYISRGQNLSFSDDITGGYRSFFLDDNHFGQKTVAKPSPAFLAVAYGSSGAEHLWQNGVELTGNLYKNYWGDVGGMAFGGRPGGSGAELKVTGYTVHAVRFYSRVLTDEELGRNYALDRVRFFAQGGFTVDEIPTQIIAEGELAEPAVTVRDVVTGEAVLSDCFEITYLNNDVAGGPDAAVAVVTGKAGTTYEGMVFRRHFTILFSGGYLPLVIFYPTNLVDVMIVAEDEKDGKYAVGSKVTLTASSPLGYEFVRWYGDVAEEDAQKLSVTVTMNSDYAMLPYFKTPWTYSSGKISDGYWEVPVNASGKDLTTKAGTTLVSVLLPILDFDKPIADDYRLVALGTDTFWGTQTYKPTLTEIRFPDSLASFGIDSCNGCFKVQNVRIGPNVTSVGTRAFHGCSSLRGFNGTDDVVLEGLTQIANAAFAGCGSICGRVVLGGEKTCDYVSGNTSEGVFEGCTRIADVKIGDGVIGLGPYPFASCSSLTNVVLGASIATLSDRFFMSCAKLKIVELGGFPRSNHSRCFDNFPSAYGTLFIVPADSADWQGFVATHVTPWKNLDATVKAKFAIPGWRKPYGLITTASSDEGLYYPVNHWIAYKPTVGMMIMIR